MKIVNGFYQPEMLLCLKQPTPANVETLRQAEACAALNQPMELFGRKWKVVSIRMEFNDCPEIGLALL